MQDEPRIQSAPRLRTDLIVSRQGSAEKPVFVIKDPVSGRFFRFREIEGFILQQLQGVNVSEDIRHRVEEQFGATLTQTTLDQFVARIGRNGLLEQANGHAVAQSNEPSSRSGSRIRGNPFYLRFSAFNPDRLLDRLVKKLMFLFTRRFVVLSAAAICFGACLTVVNWWEIGNDLPRLYSLQSLLLAYVTMLGVIGAHEFAHGLTCKRFGGKVPEM